MSSSSTCTPAFARCAAIVAPITPAPRTATLLICFIVFLPDYVVLVAVIAVHIFYLLLVFFIYYFAPELQCRGQFAAVDRKIVRQQHELLDGFILRQMFIDLRNAMFKHFFHLLMFNQVIKLIIVDM